MPPNCEESWPCAQMGGGARSTLAYLCIRAAKCTAEGTEWNRRLDPSFDETKPYISVDLQIADDRILRSKSSIYIGGLRVSLEVSTSPGSIGRTGYDSRPIRKRRPAPGESTVLSDPHFSRF